MTSTQLDKLDELAIAVANGDIDCLGWLSCGETIYVCLAANMPSLLVGDTIAESLARLGDDWTMELIKRWQYKGMPGRN